MATLRQIEARRANGRRSRGPKTPEGKAIASRNALKHGLYSHNTLLPGQDPAEWLGFRDGLVAYLAPIGEAECALAERIAQNAWRQSSMGAVEAAIFNEHFRKLRAPAELAEWAIGLAFMRDAKHGNALMQAVRVEGRLNREIHRDLKTLNARQAVRRTIENEQSNLPMALSRMKSAA